jgi:tetratricopeptide (TPR) repeat protein
MKSTTLGFARWIGWAGLVFAFSTAGSLRALAQSHNSVSFGHADQQSPPSASNAELPVITPELRADMLAVHGHYHDAIDAYSKIQPLTAEIYNKIGIAYQRMAMDSEAIAYYDRAARMDRNYAAVYNNLGTVYFRENDNKRAKRFYKKSIRLDAQMAPFWSNLGAVYLAQKKYSDGAEAYERAFNLDPGIFQELELNGLRKDESPEDLAKTYICFAEIYAHAGMKMEAIDYLQKALLEGFKDKQKLQQDQQLASLHGTPAFEQLLSGSAKR